jgi:APA family basic amino acid/polyamine antiporter
MLMNYTKGMVDAFTFVILLATLTTLVPYAFSAAAQVYLYFTDRAAFAARHMIRDTVIAGLAFAYSLWAIGNSGDDIVEKGFMLLLAGIPVYIAVKVWPSKTPAELPSLDAVATSDQVPASERMEESGHV